MTNELTPETAVRNLRAMERRLAEIEHALYRQTVEIKVADPRNVAIIGYGRALGVIEAAAEAVMSARIAIRTAWKVPVVS